MKNFGALIIKVTGSFTKGTRKKKKKSFEECQSIDNTHVVRKNVKKYEKYQRAHLILPFLNFADCATSKHELIKTCIWY